MIETTGLIALAIAAFMILAGACYITFVLKLPFPSYSAIAAVTKPAPPMGLTYNQMADLYMWLDGMEAWDHTLSLHCDWDNAVLVEVRLMTIIWSKES